MAHQLDFQRGSAAFVSYRKPAWHGLGTIIHEKITVAEALKLGQLDYTVEKLPNVHRVPGMPEVVSENSFFTYRTDTGCVLGDKLGKAYFPVQNEEALSVVDELVKEGGIVETAGALSNGARAFICVELPEDIKVGGTDIVKQYAVIACGHDGSLGILAYFTNTRVVCNNTLQASLADATQKHTIRHTKSATDRLKEAARLMGIAGKNQKVIETAYNRMANTSMLQQEFFDYVGNLFFSEAETKEMREGKRAREVASTRKLNVVRDVLNFYETGVGQKEIAGTWWGAYNAVTGYFSNVKKYDSPEARMDGLLFESGAQTMQKALALAVAPQEIKPLRATKPQFNMN